MIEPTPRIPLPEVGNIRQPRPAGAPSPTATAIVFHDPLSGSQPEVPAVGSYRPLEPCPRPSTSNRSGVRRLKKRRLASRADAIEAVARELRLLAQRRGKP